jgi:hypothetical protein
LSDWPMHPSYTFDRDHRMHAFHEKSSFQRA